jgi:hypothetical protein
MKKIISFLMMIFAVILNIPAQNSNFVEITVTDTVNLNPVNIKYLITDGGTDYSYEYDDKKKEENKYADQTALTEIEKILKNNKYSFTQHAETKTYKIGESYSYDLYNKKTGSGLLIELKSVKELENLYALLKDQKGINGKILDVSFESSDNYIDPLFKRLFAKAQKEAQVLGTLTGLKIGKVIHVSEISSNETYSIWDWYQDILAFGKYEDGLFGKELTKLYTRKMTFKFEAN